MNVFNPLNFFKRDKGAALLFLIYAILQFLNSNLLELFHDEAYYWVFSKNLAFGYFDHPPMTALWISLGSVLPKSELSVRIFFILMSFISFGIFSSLVPGQNKKLALLLFLALPAVHSLFIAVPDTPLFFFSVCYFYFLKNFLENRNIKNTIILSFIISCLLYSKYHGFIFILATLIAVPSLLKEKYFYITAVCVVLLCMPHFIWQLENDFPTLKYHFIDRPKSSFSINRLIEFIGLQFLLFAVLASPLLYYNVWKNHSKSDFEKALKYSGLGMIFFFLLSSFSKKVEGNWTMVAFVPLAIFILQNKIFFEKWVKKLLVISIVLIFILRVWILLPGIVPQPKRLNEVRGWREFTQELTEKCQGTLLANTYQYASKLSFYSAQMLPSANIGSRQNQYSLWQKPKYETGVTYCLLWNKSLWSSLQITDPAGKNLYFVQNIDEEKFHYLFPISNL